MNLLELTDAMPIGFVWSWKVDGWIVVTGMLAAIASTLLGNFLVLRKMSMLGDAITHAVLPGIAVAFYVTQSRSSLAMFVGAIIVGILTALFTEWIRESGGVDEGASMGVVFTSLFALGLVLLVQTAHAVDLDPKCVLYGSIELTWLDRIPIGSWMIPRSAVVLFPITLINGLFVVLFFKELRLTSFDPALATTMGISSRLMHYGLMVLVSVTAVACFESVGSILVVAMFVVPAAAAYLLTDRLGVMIGISVAIAAVSAVLGHLAAITVPGWFGYGSTTTSGMIAVSAGVLFVAAAALGPKHGVLVKLLRRQLLSLQILCDDIVASLFRGEELDREFPVSDSARVKPSNAKALASELFASKWLMKIALGILRRRGELNLRGEQLELTKVGRERGKRLVRSHRLWEQYLIDQAGSDTVRIHGQAERFEHFTDRNLRDELAKETDGPAQDPHGRPIPEEN